MDTPAAGLIPKKMPIGVELFSEIREKHMFYIDKTKFIRQWWDQGEKITLILRGRRFAKTLTQDMTASFFSLQYAHREDLFEGLDISRDAELMALQGTKPVISLSFADVKAQTFGEFLGDICFSLRKAYHPFEADIMATPQAEECREYDRYFHDAHKIEALLTEEPNYMLGCAFRIKTGLYVLSEWAKEHYGMPVYIFLDGYDTPLQCAYVHGYYTQALPVIQNLLSTTFKGNSNLDRAIITGVVKESMFSDFNNATDFTVLDQSYSDIFGFTREEVENACALYGLKDKVTQLEAWYEGYTVGETTGIFNPWSIINYLAKKPSEPQAYWKNAGGTRLLDHILKDTRLLKVQQKLEDLLLGKTIDYRYISNLHFGYLQGNEDAIWTLLFYAGYLKVIEEDGEKRFTLVNHETKLCLEDMIKLWYNDETKGNLMTDFADAFESEDLDRMQDALTAVVEQCVSFYDSAQTLSEKKAVRPENYFHALVLGMLSCLSEKYELKSNRESGDGRFDLQLEPRNRLKTPKAAIFEFKVFSPVDKDKTIRGTARRARRQIDKNRYDQELKSHGYTDDEIRKYGVGFKGKSVRIAQ